MNRPRTAAWLALTLLLAALPEVAWAYVGPGAGFALIGSIGTILVGMLGGLFVMATFPPTNDQNIAGATPQGNWIFLAQLVIDIYAPTNDGDQPFVHGQIGNVIWQDAAGSNFLAGFDPETGLGDPLTFETYCPAPGTLAVLGVAGVLSFRRRRRASRASDVGSG